MSALYPSAAHRNASSSSACTSAPCWMNIYTPVASGVGLGSWLGLERVCYGASHRRTEHWSRGKGSLRQPRRVVKPIERPPPQAGGFSRLVHSCTDCDAAKSQHAMPSARRK